MTLYIKIDNAIYAMTSPRAEHEATRHPICYTCTQSMIGQHCRVQYPCPSDHGVDQCYVLQHTFQI